MDQLIDRAVGALRRINDGIAIAAGLILLLTVGYILTDIVGRRFGTGLGGTEEYAGYVMAITTSWAMAYALTRLAHVRIDLVRAKLRPMGQVAMDVLALWALAATAIFIGIKAWPVFARSWRLDSAANTPLETPLWIPQILWWSGWAWFALTASIFALAIAWYAARKQIEKAEAVGGAGTEV